MDTTLAPPTAARSSGADGQPLRPVLWKVPEAMRLLNLSRSVIYEQIRCGRLRTVKLGRTRLVPDRAIDEYVRLLESEARR
jgi:excisionase family DNA binding protein